jgi:POT family proton-dependent oligopeptide transporter
MPRSIRYIIGSELAERFSFYGLQAVLVIFMTQYLHDAQGRFAPMSEAEATAYYHLFVSAAAVMPVVGALLADVLWGKFRTIVGLSIIYCAGHFTLAVDDTRTGLTLGLALIAIGNGGIKACVASLIGDQFTSANQSLLPRVYAWFFWILNFASLIATVANPLILEHVGPQLAFGLPGIFMIISAVVIWAARRDLVHVRPAGRRYLADLFSRENRGSLGGVIVVFAILAVPFGVVNLANSKMVLQAARMDLNLFGVDWLPAQIFAFNPLLGMLLIPVFTYAVFPFVERFVRVTVLRKMGAGLVAVIVFLLLLAWIEHRILLGEQPTIAWHILILAVMIVVEILIHMQVYEFCYTQAPVSAKALVMSIRFFAAALGNAYLAGVGFAIAAWGEGALAGANYYLFFASNVALALVAYLLFASRYRERRIFQDSPA